MGSGKNRIGDSQLTIEFLGRYKPREIERLFMTHIDEQTSKVIVSSGHMIDLPDRPTPRFPPSKENSVRQHLARQLDSWSIGSSDRAICGGARGSDILFAELCVERGARIRLLIALPEEEFLKQSVALPGSNWEERYLALRRHPQVETWFQHECLGPPPPDLSPFARNNLWIIDTARAEVSAGNLYAVLVWDEQPTGDGPGGTSHFAEALRHLGGRLTIINPTKL